MHRRKFITAGAAGAMAVAGSRRGLAGNSMATTTRELIEWRKYDLAWGGDQGLLRTYITETLGPALLRHGATRFQLFEEYGKPSPGVYHLMVAFPDAATYVSAQSLGEDDTFAAAAATYDAVTPDRPVYERFTSWLMNAFEGMPQSADIDAEAGLFELRIYEGYSEDAVRRKIRMFNEYEIDIFRDTGLDAVFYGDLVAGPYRPALVYLLQFADMAERDANWGKFGAHPEWNRIKNLPEFADSVSNIRRIFLVPG